MSDIDSPYLGALPSLTTGSMELEGEFDALWSLSISGSIGHYDIFYLVSSTGAVVRFFLDEGILFAGRFKVFPVEDMEEGTLMEASVQFDETQFGSRLTLLTPSTIVLNFDEGEIRIHRDADSVSTQIDFRQA